MSQNAGPDCQERLKIDYTLAQKIEEWNGLCYVSIYLIFTTDRKTYFRTYKIFVTFLGVEGQNVLMIYGLLVNLTHLKSNVLN